MCWEFSCRTFVCKKFLESIDTDITTFVQYPDYDYNSSNNENEDSDAGSDSNSDDELLDPYLSNDNNLQNNERGNHTNNEGNNILDDDNTKNFLTNVFYADITLENYNDVGNNQRRINDDELLSDPVNQITTTNAGELAYIDDEESQYSGTFGNIKIS